MMLTCVSKKARGQEGDAIYTCRGTPVFSVAAQHGPICLILLDQDGIIACTFFEDGLTMSLAFDSPTKSVGSVKQHLNVQCSTTNGPTSPGTIKTSMGGTEYGVSSHMFLSTRSRKRLSNKEILKMVKRSCDSMGTPVKCSK